MDHLYGDDVINLYLCGIGIRPDGHSDAGLKLQSTLLKLEKSLPAEYGSDIRKARERFYYDENPWWGERIYIPSLDIIRRSVWQSKKLRLLYGRGGEKNTDRKVHPYGMIVKNLEWYLAAYCEYSGGIRTFKCERIQEVEILEDTFSIPDAFSLEQYWREGERNFKKERNDAEKYKVTIKLHKYDRDLLNRLEVYKTRFEKDFIIAEINMHKFEFACREAMDIAGKAEIIGPSELRRNTSERLKTMIKTYG
jgi:predicted DNA-binding transcriptional regulator YafY